MIIYRKAFKLSKKEFCNMVINAVFLYLFFSFSRPFDLVNISVSGAYFNY